MGALKSSGLLLVTAVFLVSFTANVYAVPEHEQKLVNQGILYYQPEACGAVSSGASSDSDLQPGNGSPTGLTFPNLSPAAMGDAINKYIQNTNKNSVFIGLGDTFVSGAENSNINPFFLVALAHKETSLGDKNDYNVKNGNNAFGRTATQSQPNFQGSRTWYYWSSPKASIDHTAPENQRPSGDHSSYIRDVYGTFIDDNDLRGLMNKYAPPFENDTELYIKQVQDRMKAMANLADSSGAVDTSGSTPSTSSVGEGATNTALEGSKLYMLGDSISVGAKSLLTSGFSENDINAFINASVSRSIQRPGTTAGFTTSGLGAIDTPADQVQLKDEKTKTVVIALGTNGDGDGSATTYSKNMQTLIEKIRQTNGNANIFAVNIFSPAVTNRADLNDALQKLSQRLGFTVIDVASKNISTSDNIHPDNAGRKLFVDTVIESVVKLSNSDGSPVDVAGGCVCPVSGSGGSDGTQARGGENAEIVFNFFIDKGYKDFQAAAIVGNMTHESGVEPLRQQGIFDRLVRAEEFPVSGGDSGWGLVQWTPGTKIIQPSKSSGKDPNDILVQLEFLYTQLEGNGPVPEKVAGTELKGTPNLEEAVKAFQGTRKAGGKYSGFERPADQSGSIPERTENARKTLEKYGGAASGGSAQGAQTNPNCNNASGETSGGGTIIGDLAWPVPIKYVNSNFEWFTKPHHDHPSSDIPVPSGTPVYSITSGEVLFVSQTGNGNGFGAFLTIETDGVLVRYQHATVNSITVKTGDQVSPGQLIMKSGNTGFSTGPHLHVSMESGGSSPTYRGLKGGGTEYCPQALFRAMKDNSVIPKLTDLPTSGCVGGTTYN